VAEALDQDGVRTNPRHSIDVVIAAFVEAAVGGKPLIQQRAHINASILPGEICTRLIAGGIVVPEKRAA